jgi:DNA-binding MarR family transcriptional regulator
METDNKNSKLIEISRMFFEMMPLIHKLKLSYKGIAVPSSQCNKSQNVAIMMIGRAGQMTPSSLSKLLVLEKGSITTLIDSLVQMGLVNRSADPADRRKTFLSLTAQGEDQMHEIAKHRQQMMEKTFELLNEEEIEDLYQSIQTIKKIVGNLADRQSGEHTIL